MQTHPLTITQGIGYTGLAGKPAWVAEITGTDRRYGLARLFRDAERVERDHFGRRYTRTYGHDLSTGLYEVSEHGKRWFLLVWSQPDGTIDHCKASDERVIQMANLMDAGHDVEAARRATMPAPQSVAAQEVAS